MRTFTLIAALFVISVLSGCNPVAKTLACTGKAWVLGSPDDWVSHTIAVEIRGREVIVQGKAVDMVGDDRDGFITFNNFGGGRSSTTSGSINRITGEANIMMDYNTWFIGACHKTARAI
jgi:hypothetical protein